MTKKIGMDLSVITRDAQTCIIREEKSTWSSDIGVTVGVLHRGNPVVNISIDKEGLLILILEKDDAAKLCSELAKIILEGEVLQ